MAGVREGDISKLYLDGVLVSVTTQALTTIKATYSFGLGARYNGSWGYYFNGYMADVRLWDYARSAAEIALNKGRRLMGDESGLAGYWPLNDGHDSAMAKDLSGTGNDGVVSKAVWFDDESLALETDSCILYIDAVPELYGTPEPPYGLSGGIEHAQNFTVSASDGYMPHPANDNIRAYCAGYSFYTNINTAPLYHGNTRSFSYTHNTNYPMSLVRWQWVEEYFSVFEATTGGTTSLPQGWLGQTNIVVTATPEPGAVFSHWEGNVPDEQRFSQTLSFGVTGVINATAVFSESVYYLRPDGDDLADGLSWDTARQSLQPLLESATSGTVIHMAGGGYSNSTAFVWNKSGVTVVGGYAGSGDNPDANDPRRWPTVLQRWNNNAQRILLMENVNKARLEGVTIRGGNVMTGAGIQIANSEIVEINNTIIEDNNFSSGAYAARDGGGLYLTGSSVSMSNCIVRYNSGANNLGAINGAGIYSNGRLKIRDSQIVGNKTEGKGDSGAGILFAGTTLDLFNVLIAGNVTGGAGGGITLANGVATVINCTIAENSNEGVLVTGGSMFVTNSIIAGNMCDMEGTFAISHSHVGDRELPGSHSSGDPLFEFAYYLVDESPCRASGSGSAAEFGLQHYSTGASGAPYLPGATVNLGYHYLPGTVFDDTVVELYVDPAEGDNSNSGISAASPLLTLSQALSMAQDGTTIHLAAGNYMVNSEIFPLSVKRIVGLTLAGAGGDETVINAGGSKRIFEIEQAVRMTISGMTLRGGAATYAGGLMIVNCQKLTIEGCTIRENVTSGGGYGTSYGAAIYAVGCSVSVTNSTISHNTGGSKLGSAAGGAIYSNRDMAIRDTAIVDNTLYSAYPASDLGAGIYASGRRLDLKNVLLARNYTVGAGGGIYVAGGEASLLNCTVADNQGSGVERAGGTLTLTNTIVACNTDDLSGEASVVWSHIGDTNWGGNNSSGDPLFVYKYYLADDSPCKATGSDTADSLGMLNFTTRMDGQPYESTAIIDKGYHYKADEKVEARYLNIYVSSDGSDENSGTVAQEPLQTITKALSLAESGSKIYIAAGSYTRQHETFPLTIDSKVSLQIVGEGAGETVIDASGSGKRVIEFNLAQHPIISGVTLRGGSQSPGAGIYIEKCNNMVINGVIIEDNTINGSSYGTLYGAGLVAGASQVTMTDSVVRRNKAGNKSSGTATGAGIHSSGTFILRDSFILDNSLASNASYATNDKGAGIYFGGTEFEVVNVLISGNKLGGKGGGVYLAGGNLAITNATIADNELSGVYGVGGTAEIVNSIVWGNGDDINGAMVTAAYSCVSNGVDYIDGGNNMGSDPRFKQTEDQYYMLSDGSPCINAGVRKPWMEKTFDLAGNKRISAGGVDMGCYEKQAAAATILLLR